MLGLFYMLLFEMHINLAIHWGMLYGCQHMAKWTLKKYLIENVWSQYFATSDHLIELYISVHNLSINSYLNLHLIF